MPNQRRCLAALIAIVAAFLAAIPPVWADAPAESPSAGPSIAKVRIGFGGLYKVGRWTPIAVDIRAERPGRVHWSIEVPDPHGNPTICPGPAVEFQQAGVKTVETLFRTGRLEGYLRLRIDRDARRVRFDSEGAEAERLVRLGDDSEDSLRPALQQSAVLVATLGRPAGLKKLPEMVRPVHVAELDAATELPSESAAYDGLDVLFINGNQPITRRQSEAIRGWVRSGGHLTLSVGRDAPAFQAGRLYDWLGELIPLSGNARLTNLDLGGLESFAGRREQIVVKDQQWRAVLAVGRRSAADPDGEAAAARFRGQLLIGAGAGEPLVAAVPCGFGKVTFFGIDLDHSPIAEWKPLPRVLQKLVFEEFPIRLPQHVDRGGRLSSSGVSDLATQLLSALEQFPELRPMATWTVMMLFLVYLAVIGPADYFLVHRLLRKPSITWLSFPCIVALAAALALWTARTANSGEARMNQIDLIDIDATAGAEQFVRTRSWMTLYSPGTQRNRVTVTPRAGALESSDAAAAPFRLSWAGVPESSFGGMYRSGGIEFGRAGYHYTGGAAEVEDLPTVIWSTASLSATRLHVVPESTVESDLASPAYGVLTGTIQHRLPGPLRDWMLAYGPSVYRPPDESGGGETAAIEPETVWSPEDPDVMPQELVGYLTRTRLKEVQRSAGKASRDPEYRLAQTEYDPFNRRPAEILRMITFYRRVGGEKYTRLHNDGLRRFDCSTLLDLNRAVLFARIDAPAAEYNINGERIRSAARSTFVRIVLPVRQTK